MTRLAVSSATGAYCPAAEESSSLGSSHDDVGLASVLSCFVLYVGSGALNLD